MRVTPKNFVIDSRIFKPGDTVIKLYQENGYPMHFSGKENIDDCQKHIYYVVKSVSKDFIVSPCGRKQYRELMIQNKWGLTTLPSYCVKHQTPPSLAVGLCQDIMNIDPKTVQNITVKRFDYCTKDYEHRTITPDEFRASIEAARKAYLAGRESHQDENISDWAYIDPESVDTDEKYQLYLFMADAYKSGDSNQIAKANVIKILMCMAGELRGYYPFVTRRDDDAGIYHATGYSKLLNKPHSPDIGFKPTEERW